MRPQAQPIDISQYQWKNRLIILVSESIDDTTLVKQLQEFKEFTPNLEERKLIILGVTHKGEYILFKDGIYQTYQLSSDNNRFSLYSLDNVNSTFLLLGLDGDIKVKRSELVTAEELFSIIDSMPMRSAEIRRKNK